MTLSKRINISVTLILMLIAGFVSLSPINAASNSTFTQTINPGILSIDIVDNLYATVATPGVAFPPIAYGFLCQTNTGTLGTATQQIYITNPGVANNGWTANIAGSATTAVWDGTPADYDFNDASGAGCTDGADADTVGGQMTINPATGTIAVGQCVGCTTTGVTLGTSTAYVEGTTNTVTLLTAAAGADDIGDIKLTGVTVTQKIPAQQAAAADYDINMVLSVLAI